jgi:hypothetical protein
MSYRINSNFPQPYVTFEPNSLGKFIDEYELNGEKVTCKYKLMTGVPGKELLLKTLTINYGLDETLKISQVKELNFEEDDLEHKTIVLEDFFKIRGNLYRVIMQDAHGWRLQPRMMLTHFKFLDPSEEAGPRLKVYHVYGLSFIVYKNLIWVGDYMANEHFEFENLSVKTNIIEVPIKKVHNMNINQSHGNSDLFTLTLLILNQEGVTEILAY